jgi:transcriptional regulator with XRE-family HTH domain
MHALGKFLQQEIDARGWRISDLVTASGLSKQTVYNLFEDKRDRMEQTPQRRTIVGLANALGIPETAILTAAAEAIGVPGNRRPPASRPIQEVSDQELLQEIARRFRGQSYIPDNPPAVLPQEAPEPPKEYGNVGEIAKAGPAMHRKKRQSLGEESSAASKVEPMGISHAR